jgi:hypothetical protein
MVPAEIHGTPEDGLEMLRALAGCEAVASASSNLSARLSTKPGKVEPGS